MKLELRMAYTELTGHLYDITAGKRDEESKPFLSPPVLVQAALRTPCVDALDHALGRRLVELGVTHEAVVQHLVHRHFCNHANTH